MSVDSGAVEVGPVGGVEIGNDGVSVIVPVDPGMVSRDAFFGQTDLAILGSADNHWLIFDPEHFSSRRSRDDDKRSRPVFKGRGKVLYALYDSPVRIVFIQVIIQRQDFFLFSIHDSLASSYAYK